MAGQRQEIYGRERMAGYANGYGRARFGREREDERVGYRERLRFAELRRARGFGYGGYAGGYGDSGYDSGSYDSGDIGSYPAAGTYGNAGFDGSTGSYASAGTYGGSGIYPAPGVYENELDAPGTSYRSEDAARCPICRGLRWGRALTAVSTPETATPTRLREMSAQVSARGSST